MPGRKLHSLTAAPALMIALLGLTLGEAKASSPADALTTKLTLFHADSPPMNQFLGDWLIAGPFSISDARTLDLPAEDMFAAAQEGAPIQWLNQSAMWRRVEAGFLDFNDLFDLHDPRQRQAALVVTTVPGGRAGFPCSLAVGADDGAYVWWNGELLQRARAWGGFVLDDVQSQVWVGPGENRLAMIVHNFSGLWRAGARLLPAGEGAFSIGVRLRLDSVTVNGERLSTGSLAGCGTAPVVRRTIPLAAFMNEAPLFDMRVMMSDGMGRLRFTETMDGYGGLWSGRHRHLFAPARDGRPAQILSAGVDADGRCAWEIMDPETWTIRLSGGGPGLRPVEWSGPIRTSLEVDVTGTQTLDVLVMDAAGGRPVAGAIVEAGSSWQAGLLIEGRTDAAGHCRIAGLPAGMIQVRAGAPGAAPAMKYIRICPGEPVTHAALEVDSGAAVTSLGTMVWAGTGDPLPGARLHWSSSLGTGVFAITDTQGDFALRGVEGSVPIIVACGAFTSTWMRLGADRTAPPRSGLEISRRVLAGRVTGAAGQGVEGAWLTGENVRRESIGTASGTDGRAVLEHNLEGAFWLAVHGHEGTVFERIPAGEAMVEREWRLGAARRVVRGYIRSTDGRPLDGLEVRVGPEDRVMGLGLLTATMPDGYFELRGLARQDLRLQVEGFTREGKQGLLWRDLPADEDEIALTVEQPVRQTWRLAIVDARTSAPLPLAVARIQWRGQTGAEPAPISVRAVGPGYYEAGVEWPVPAIVALGRPGVSVAAPEYGVRELTLEELAGLPRARDRIAQWTNEAGGWIKGVEREVIEKILVYPRDTILVELQKD